MIGQNKCSTSEINGQLAYVINSNNNVEYIIKQVIDNKLKTYTLLTNNSDCWSDNAKDKILFQIIDNGNGYKFKIPNDDGVLKRFKQDKLDYHIVLYIQILLQFIESKEKYKETFKFLIEE
jgi:hypothetical protein